MKSSDKNTQMLLNQENLTTNVKHVKDMPGNLNTKQDFSKCIKSDAPGIRSTARLRLHNHHELPFVALVNRLIEHN